MRRLSGSKCALRSVSLPLLAATLGLISSTARAQPIRIGGFNATRSGSYSGIISGTGWEPWRAEFGSNFQPATFASTTQLTPAFLSSVDLLLISAVAEGNNIQMSPLTAQEQAALFAFVNAGGRAIIATDNSIGYTAASNSLLAPFGLAASGTINGIQRADTVTSPPACSVVRGPFGNVNILQGGWPGWYSTTGTATVLARWQANGTPALASGAYSAGKVVFMADADVLGTPFLTGSDSDTGRRNALWWLGVRPQTQPASASKCPDDSVTFALPFPSVAGVSYQWFHDADAIAGATSPNLVLSNALQPGQYSCQITGPCGVTTTYPATLIVCFGDFNCDGGVDGADVTDFFAAWEGGQPSADINGDGGIDGADVSAFFERWESGC